MKALLLCMALAGWIGCGPSPCEDICRDIRAKLIDNFGIPADRIDCSTSEWDDADTCEECKNLFGKKYDVYPQLDCTKF